MTGSILIGSKQMRSCPYNIVPIYTRSLGGFQVHSVSEVLAETTALNLQMFHRHSDMPPLPERLRWPLPEIFGGNTDDAKVAHAVNLC
jgi:hypothetical protein